MSWLSIDPERLGTRHVQVFVPSVDRNGDQIPRGQEYWVEECLRVLGVLFGGATAFPRARGVWRDDEHDGTLVFDDTVIVFSYARDDSLSDANIEALGNFVDRLGREGQQGEVGVFVDGTYYGRQNFDVDEGG